MKRTKNRIYFSFCISFCGICVLVGVCEPFTFVKAEKRDNFFVFALRIPFGISFACTMGGDVASIAPVAPFN